MFINHSPKDPQKSLPALERLLLPCPKLLLTFLRLCPAEREGNHTSYFHWCSKYLLFLTPLLLLSNYVQSDFPLQTLLMMHLSPLVDLHLWRLPHSHPTYGLYIDLRLFSWRDISDCTFLSRGSFTVLTGLTSQHVDSAGCAAACDSRLVECWLYCFDHGSGYLCSTHTWYFGVENSVCSARFGCAQWKSSALVLKIAVCGSNCVLSPSFIICSLFKQLKPSCSVFTFADTSALCSKEKYYYDRTWGDQMRRWVMMELNPFLFKCGLWYRHWKFGVG